jgi:hypothetical protein
LWIANIALFDTEVAARDNIPVRSDSAKPFAPALAAQQGQTKPPDLHANIGKPP